MAMASSKDAKRSDPRKQGKFIDGGDRVPLVNEIIFYYLMFVSLTLPNIIFSGVGWFDTLHIMKWTFAMVPIALVCLIGGLKLVIFGPERTDFKLDAFALIWLFMLAYISIQPLWVRHIMSWSTYYKEWFFFACLIGAYVFCYNLFKDRSYLRLCLFCSCINAAANAIFAELLFYSLNGPFPFIMNVPGNYIGNTGQQNMFGLWMSIALANGVYLHMTSDFKKPGFGEKFYNYANLLMIAVNAWGLWNSTSRSAAMGLFTAMIILAVMVHRAHDKTSMRKIGQSLAIVLIMLAATVIVGNIYPNRPANALLGKTLDMFENAGNVANRREIWITSWEVVKSDPIRGVGIGQYKWHYLEGQRRAFVTHPEMKWQFTYWAHNEYLQWFAEFGIFGLVLLLALGAWWLWCFRKALIAEKISSECMWACAMLFLIFADAILTRPFHRIENAVWISLAFAIANRELLPYSFKWSEIKHASIYRIFGIFAAAISLVALFFLASGLRGDQYLWRSTRTRDAGLQRYLIDEALRLPMARDDAEQQYAYHLMAVATATRKRDDWNKALVQLYRTYTIRPQAKQLIEIINLARQLGNTEILNKAVIYLQPNVPATPGAQSPDKPQSGSR
ncbi:MAG: O-antigen ligase family protein [Synergistaceae bacterium]|nr:O-antigen ligase family protein [Synergistaceae bacterium]